MTCTGLVILVAVVSYARSVEIFKRQSRRNSRLRYSSTLLRELVPPSTALLSSPCLPSPQALRSLRLRTTSVSHFPFSIRTAYHYKLLQNKKTEKGIHVTSKQETPEKEIRTFIRTVGNRCLTHRKTIKNLMHSNQTELLISFLNTVCRRSKQSLCMIQLRHLMGWREGSNVVVASPIVSAWYERHSRKTVAPKHTSHQIFDHLYVSPPPDHYDGLVM